MPLDVNSPSHLDRPAASSSNRPSVAIVGTGISGMSAAWLLASNFDVTVFEAAGRIGGHTNTVTCSIAGEDIAVDTGFIVYNEQTYPNLAALFDHLGVKTGETNMSFAASLRGGSTEYSGETLAGLIAQKRNIFRPRFWSMLLDLQRFYRLAPAASQPGIGYTENQHATLGDFLERHKFGPAFIEDHLLPLSAAIWSAPPSEILNYPVEAFVRFHENHGLLKFVNRPIWRTVEGGSSSYVEKLTAGYSDTIRLNSKVCSIRRTGTGVELTEEKGNRATFDHVVLATHANQALAMLSDPSELERNLLSGFRYSRNEAWLHSDPTLMPKRKKVWASWNFLSSENQRNDLVVTYWMNKLQNLQTEQDLFVTLNPQSPPRENLCHCIESYEHPVNDFAALNAQKKLWSLQGTNGTWFCGAYFGAGFHEDGLQSGLAVAEQLVAQAGNNKTHRPWKLENESGRIHIGDLKSNRPTKVMA